MLLKFKTRCLLLITSLSFLISCQKEDPLNVSMPGTNVFYKLPQGNQPYDDKIVELYNKYNCFILYKFDSVDYNYNLTGNVFDNLSIVPADTNYITEALGFLDKNLFNLYPDAFLKKSLPFSILLASDISVNVTDRNESGVHRLSAISSVRSLSFGIVNDSLGSLTSAQLDSTRGLLQMYYWQLAINNGNLDLPDSWSDFSSTNFYYEYASKNPRANGILPVSLNLWMFPKFDYFSDFLGYIDLITSSDSATIEHTWLDPAVDVKGLYRKKYEMIINYYKDNYGIDLQAIGNLKN